MPTPAELVDSFGRVHRDLRISVTDRCNLRCTYCMPEEGMDWLDRHELLTFEEIERLARMFVERFGFDSIRLTGGEPTVRAHLPVLVAQAGRPRHRPRPHHQRRHPRPRRRRPRRRRPRGGSTSRSTRCAASRVETLTRRDVLDRVLEGIDAALAAGLTPGEAQRRRRAGHQRRRGGRAGRVRPRPGRRGPLHRVHAARRRRRLAGRPGRAGRRDRRRHRRPLAARGRWCGATSPPSGGATSTGEGEIGVIPSVTEAFCSSCDRVRLTADGQLRACLFAVEETDLRAPLRAGASDDELAELIQAHRGRQVGWSRHHPGRLLPAPAVDVADRRLKLSRRRTLPAPYERPRTHPPRSTRPRSHGRRHAQGGQPPAGRGPGPGG